MPHPYSDLADRQFWRRAVSARAWDEVEIFEAGRFALDGASKIATAGSCFAQNFARHLRQTGRAVYLAEPPHPLMPAEMAEQMGYFQYTARYGNIYTPRQLRELFDQAFDYRPMIEDFAAEGDRVFDLLRPAIQPDGFVSLEEARVDRAFHLGCVRRMFVDADALIFTLGLTETWLNAQQDFVYPACPGTIRGEYRPDAHRFVNFTPADLLADLEQFIQRLRAVNGGIKIVLTVSPVALVATYETENVVLASSYSKAALRAVCSELRRKYEFVEYFPSYEIIASPCSLGRYLDSDLRGVNELGVNHVMSCFFRAFRLDGITEAATKPPAAPSPDEHLRLAEQLVAADCDEVFNDPAHAGRTRPSG